MPESAKPRVAVIGLGSMGFGMATSLRRAGLRGDRLRRLGGLGRSGSWPTAARAPGRRRKPPRRPTSSSAWSSTPPKPKPSCSAPTASPKPSARARCSSPPPPWIPTWRGGWRNSWRRPGGTIWTRRSPAARSARRRANSPSWRPAVRPPLPRRARRSMRWRQSSTNSAMTPARARRSR